MTIRSRHWRAISAAIFSGLHLGAHAAEQASLLGPALWVMGLVIALGLAGWLAYRRQRVLTSLPGPQFEIIAHQSLGPREKLWLVQLSGRRYVLGQTAQHITFIDLIDAPPPNPAPPDPH